MKTAAAALIFAFALAVPCAHAQTDREWDGLVRVDSRNFDAVYLAPGVNFSGYTKVMLDPTEVAFKRDWQRNFNSGTGRGASSRISDDEARQILDKVKGGFEDVFADAYRAAGYQVVTTPGADVLRLRTAVLNIDIVAPDAQDPGITRSFSSDAGEATLVLEARDSMSNALLGRGVDRRAIGDSGFMRWRTRASNTTDFRRIFQAWAEKSAQALGRLRATPAAAAAPATG